MNAIRKVGILGLGKMGAPMAQHLLAKGYNVAGYDPVDAARRNAASLGVSVLDSPREVARASDVVIVVVGFDREVEAVLFGSGGVMEAARPGLIVAIGSTVAPRYAARAAERLREQRVVLLDAPLARGERADVGDGPALGPLRHAVGGEGYEHRAARSRPRAPLPAALRHGEGDHQGPEDPPRLRAAAGQRLA